MCIILWAPYDILNNISTYVLLLYNNRIFFTIAAIEIRSFLPSRQSKTALFYHRGNRNLLFFTIAAIEIRSFSTEFSTKTIPPQSSLNPHIGSSDQTVPPAPYTQTNSLSKNSFRPRHYSPSKSTTPANSQSRPPPRQYIRPPPLLNRPTRHHSQILSIHNPRRFRSPSARLIAANSSLLYEYT